MDGSTGSDARQGADILDGPAPNVNRRGKADFVAPRDRCPPKANGYGAPFDPKSELACLYHVPRIGFALGPDNG